MRELELKRAGKKGGGIQMERSEREELKEMEIIEGE